MLIVQCSSWKWSSHSSSTTLLFRLVALTSEGQFVDMQNFWEISGSMRLTGEAIHGQTKHTCPMFVNAAINQSMGSSAEVKFDHNYW